MKSGTARHHRSESKKPNDLSTGKMSDKSVVSPFIVCMICTSCSSRWYRSIAISIAPKTPSHLSQSTRPQLEPQLAKSFCTTNTLPTAKLPHTTRMIRGKATTSSLGIEEIQSHDIRESNDIIARNLRSLIELSTGNCQNNFLVFRAFRIKKYVFSRHYMAIAISIAPTW